MTDVNLPMGPDEIMEVLPHRPPFLFVDTITEIGPGARVVGTKRLEEDEWIIQGHFPGHPVMPGVIILEAIAQVGAVLTLTDDEYRGKIPLFAGADKVRWKKPVRPGDELTIEVEITKTRGPIGWGTGKATVDGELACTAEIIFAVADAEEALSDS